MLKATAQIVDETSFPTASRPRSWVWFLAWAIVGVGNTFALLAVMTIGLFIFPIVAIAAVVLVLIKQSHGGAPGLISGLGLPFLYIAYLNRSGPGEVCTTIGVNGSSCTDEWSPWPWFAIGVTLVFSGIAVFRSVRRTRREGDS